MSRNIFVWRVHCTCLSVTLTRCFCSLLQMWPFLFARCCRRPVPVFEVRVPPGCHQAGSAPASAEHPRVAREPGSLVWGRWVLLLNFSCRLSAFLCFVVLGLFLFIYCAYVQSSSTSLLPFFVGRLCGYQTYMYSACAGLADLMHASDQCFQ